jgi:uncharacterized protein (TIGR02246 family)
MNDAGSGDLVSEVVESFMISWNRHDAHGFASLFAMDAVFTNVVGETARGREAIEAFHDPLFRSIFKDSRLSAEDVHVRAVGKNVSSADLVWIMTGALDSDGNIRPPRRGIINFLITREGDGPWRIMRMQNLGLANRAEV